MKYDIQSFLSKQFCYYMVFVSHITYLCNKHNDYTYNYKDIRKKDQKD